MIDTIIIQTAFLSKTPGNDIDRNCLSPFFHNTDLPCIPLLLENEIQNEIVKNLIQLVHLFDSKSDFFELKVKSLILDCFYQLLLENKINLKTIAHPARKLFAGSGLCGTISMNISTSLFL